MTGRPPDLARARVLSSIARYGLAHSLFGLVYERAVDVPGRLARDPEPSLYSSSSPTRYFLPTAPITRAVLALAVVLAWRPGHRLRLGTVVVAVTCETVVTVHLVRDLNPRLFVVGRQADPVERQRLLRSWHRLNLGRIAAEGLAWLALSDGFPSIVAGRRRPWRGAALRRTGLSTADAPAGQRAVR